MLWRLFRRAYSRLPERDYAGFLSDISCRRQPSPIRALQPYVNRPGMISLGGGMPNPCTFPVESLSFSLSGDSSATPICLTPQRLTAALQYSPTAGFPDLIETLFDFQILEHGREKDVNNLQLCVTNGSQEGLARAFEMLLNPGDGILVENPSYCGAISALRPLNPTFFDVKTDNFGLVPASLREVLISAKDHPKRPRVLYTVPTGGNPTGATLTLERKKEIYKIACEFNIIILEDDPYYYLQFDSQHRIPSFFHLDEENRVLRFDSFSKILSSGLRVGYVTGPRPLIRSLLLHGETSTLHPCGLSQAVVLSILEQWGFDGFLSHTRKVAAFYKAQGEAMLEACEKHLTGLATWNTELSAGMFLWIKLEGVDDAAALTRDLIEKRVLLVPGSAFVSSGGPTPYLRAAFSLASPAQMDEALGRLATVLKEVRG
eukprot:m.51192 g.51192  ORF g.51192 m.51192 type:complete len:432 (-) comp6592_c0_seq1:162-1457(-)